jgi:recombination protein RecT
VGNDVQVRDEDIRSLVSTQVWSKRSQFATLLPSDVDVDTFAGAAAAAMYKNKQLAATAMRNPESLLIALRDCARLGHTPGTDEYALTVRGGGVMGIEQYQGVIHRMYQAGAVKAVHAEVVTKQEKLVRNDPFPPKHEVPNDDWMIRDIRVENLKGAYAYAVLEGGVISRVVVMGAAQIMTHREKAATKAIWDSDFGISMWLKTVTHELEKWVPTSASYRLERLRADTAYATMAGQVPQDVVHAPATVDPESAMGEHAQDAQEASGGAQ